MSRLAGMVDLHNVTSISVDKIDEHDNPENHGPGTFVTRRVSFAFSDGTDFTVNLFGNEFEDLAVNL